MKSLDMALKPEDYDFLTNLGPIWPIIVGALLATMGGLVGSQLEWYLERGRREHDSALLFSELLSTLLALLDFAADRKKVGEPYGPVTLRMLRSARREIEIYERNRENLFALRDGELRAKIHATILRLTMPIDGIFDSCEALETLNLQLKMPNLPAEDRKELEARIARIYEDRDGGFEFIMDTAHKQLSDVVKELARYSGPAHQAIHRVANAQ